MNSRNLPLPPEFDPLLPTAPAVIGFNSLIESRSLPKPTAPVSFDQLTREYWRSQVNRIQAVVEKIVEAGSVVSNGRVLPEDDSLVIGQGRRLRMAVLFLDVSSFSERLSNSASEQEILLRILNLFFTEMVRVAEDYGGTVEKNTGDGLMAYFEDSSDHTEDNGCKRAVAAALSMFYANAYAISPLLASSGIAPLQFRIGIDHGPVTIARVGAAKRFNSLVAIGATANVACKMLSSAEPDELVIGDRVVRNLPVEWHRYCVIKPTSSGWVYVPTGKPYPFYRYTGRWIPPK
jgi:class 3 adenylate cyclase